MYGKKLFLLLSVLTLLATTGGLLWLWWADSPPKPPLRSRSVHNWQSEAQHTVFLGIETAKTTHTRFSFSKNI